MIILAGEAGVGKSMLCYSLALALSSGTRFLGRQLNVDKVVYFDEENSRPDSDAYHRRIWMGLGKPPVEILDSNMYLYHFALSRMYEADMRKAVEETHPALIIIDTANSACRIDDENDNALASRAIKSLRNVRLAAGRDDCTMLVLKHAKVTHDKKGNEYRDIRGAKTWTSELDGLIVHTATRGRPPGHHTYRHTFLWPHKSRAFGLLHPIEIVPCVEGDAVRFDAAEKIPG